MNRFEISPTPLAGLVVVQRRVLGDERGSLARLFCSEDLLAAGWTDPIAQINLTRTTAPGTLRGMHFQKPPHAERKLVTCLHGTVWDVAVDVRRDSPTFLKWHAEELSAQNCRALLIPPGFAHGFQTLSKDCELLYCHSAPYVPASEAALNPLDPVLHIPWPLAVSVISERDRSHPAIPPDFAGVLL